MSQNNSAQNTTEQTNTTNNTQAKETPSLGAPATSTALIRLFEKAADHLEPHELKYMAGLDEAASLEAENMASVLMNIGCFFNNTDKLTVPEKEGIATMFFSLSHQMDTISGLLSVSAEANYRLEQAKQQNAGQ